MFHFISRNLDFHKLTRAESDYVNIMIFNCQVLSQSDTKNINNILVTHFQILFFTTTIGIFIPKYYIHQNENLILYVKLYHQIPAPVLPWQLPENFDLKSVNFDYVSYNHITFHNVNLVVHKLKTMP